ncbi:MAG: DUF5615 family PIN-like protein [Actinobacteria bacterium]|nr:DUF5615 family PIN-like protein [Actinomycetota bacterium]
MRFLIDAQLPPALARMLAEHDHVAEHVTDIVPGDAPDAQLWRYALDHDAVIVTKDADFAQMVAISDESPTVVWVRVGNTRRTELLTWFEPPIEQIVSMVEQGDKLIELR